jgi:hypothetical protein
MNAMAELSSTGTYGGRGPIIADDGYRVLEQVRELERLILTGALPPDAVGRGLQHLISGEPVTTCTVPSHFASLAAQLANVEKWNDEFDWGFTPDVFARRAIEARMFEWPGDRLRAIVLVPTLSTVHATFSVLAKIATSRDRGGLRLSPQNGAADGVRLLDDVVFRANTLEWRMVDLGHSARSVKDLVTPENAARAEVMAAAAHFPRWVEAIMKGRAPHMCVPGYRFCEPGNQAPAHGIILYDGGLIRTTPLIHGSDTVWEGEVVATSYPVPLGGNVA